jgi:hypothetical protein
VGVVFDESVLPTFFRDDRMAQTITGISIMCNWEHMIYSGVPHYKSTSISILCNVVREAPPLLYRIMSKHAMIASV